MLSVRGYLERPDLGRAPDVGTAAQLSRKAIDLHDAHEVPVLLTEEHQRPEIARLLQCGGVVADRLVFGYLKQALLLYTPEIFLAHPAGVPVVEAQPVGPDVASGLDDVLAEDGAQGPVQNVSRSVVSLYLVAAHPVYGGGHPVALLYVPALGSRAYDLVTAGWYHIEDLKLAAFRGEPTLICHLAAARSVEGILRQNHVKLSTRRLLDGEDVGLNLLPLVPDEPALYLPVPERRHEPLVALHGLPGPRALPAHALLEARLVQGDTPVREHLPRDLDRETVGVVHCERHVPREVPAGETTYLCLQELQSAS